MKRLPSFRLARSWALLVSAVAFVLALGCEQTTAQQRQAPATLDDLFVAVANRVPEFGGMFLGPDQSKLNVYLTSVSRNNVTAVRRAIVAVFGASVIPQGGIEARQGRYGFLQLKEWYTRMEGPIWGTPGVTFTDIDEAKNRLGIGVEQSAGEAPVVEVLAGLGIPREAVEIQVTGRIEPLAHTVRMPNSFSAWPYARQGSYVITRLLCNQTGVGIAEGSLGFNIRGLGPFFGAGFVTVSHMTAAWWHNDVSAGFPPANFYQSDGYWPANLVGVEATDPQGFTGGACPIGHVCRYSDSAVIRYNPNVTPGIGYGRIARTIGLTTSVGNPILQVDHGGNHPGEFWIVAKPQTPYLVGLPLHKVGKTTGRTLGTIQQTNVVVQATPGFSIQVVCPGGLLDPTLPPANALYLSQYVVGHPINDVVDAGDSGSPVIRIPFSSTKSPTNDVELYGIVWARPFNTFKTFIFSPIGGVPFQPTGIQTDLGAFRYCVPGSNPC